MKIVTILGLASIILIFCSLTSLALDFADPIFNVRMDYSVPMFVRGCQFADMDGDGDQDYIIAHHRYGNVGVRICKNEGDGSYPINSYFTITRPGDEGKAYCADFDGDNDYDIALLIRSNDSLYIYENTTSGGTLSFSLLSSYEVGDLAECLYGADMDGDSDCDIIIGNITSTDFSVLLNNGDGTFAAPLSYGTGVLPYTIVAKDLDGDDINDVVIGNGASLGYISVYLNNGDGTFGSGANYNSDYYSRVWIEDVDGDTHNDILVPDPNGVAVFYNLGNGLFGFPVDYLSEYSTSDVYASDLDGDLDQDILAIHYGLYDRLSVLINLGSRYFAPAELYAVSNEPSYLAAADIDGDSDIDVGVLNQSPGNYSILKNNGDGTFITSANYVAGHSPTGVASEDFNGDGFYDVVTANGLDSNVSIYFNDGMGSFSPRVNYHVGVLPGVVYSSDFDGDDDYDLAVATYNEGIAILLNTGGGVFAPPVKYSIYHEPYDVVGADFDGDGDIDLAVSNLVVSMLFNYGDGTFSPPINYDHGGSPRGLCAADFDNDDDIDLATADYGSESFSVFINIGNGSLLPRVSYNLEGDVKPLDIVSADFDLDNDEDIVVACTADSEIEYFINDGDGTFEIYEFFFIGQGEDITSMAVSYISDDSFPDIVYTNQNTNNVYVLYSQEEDFWQAPHEYGVDGHPMWIAAADFDNDGDDDFVTANRLHNSISVLYNLWDKVECDCTPADADNSGAINVADAVYLINYVFKGGPAPQPYALCSGDANCDCTINVGDAVYIINYIFKGGLPPCDCETWVAQCGLPR